MASRAGALVLVLWAVVLFPEGAELSVPGVVLGGAVLLMVIASAVVLVPWQAEQRASYPRLLFSRAAELIVIIPLVVCAGLVLASRYRIVPGEIVLPVAVLATFYVLISIVALEWTRRRADRSLRR